jgi:lysine-specific demethylase/histidyl-hydroxylase NO66
VPASRSSLLLELLLPNIALPAIQLLQVGDVLYLPRGTIHQAVAQSEDSGHLTISTYQRWSAADLLQYTVSVALANPQLQPLLPAGLKAGLPPRFLSAASLDAGDAVQLAVASGGFGEDPEAFDVPESVAAGGSKGAGSKAALARQLAAACRSMAKCLEDPELGPRLLQTAADAMGEDFMRSR